MYQLGLTDRPTLPMNSVFEKGNVHHETYRRSQTLTFPGKNFPGLVPALYMSLGRELHSLWT